MKILFMGTPDFAAIALSAICDAGEDVIGVITLPDRPVGRGYKLTPSAVKVCALERNIPVYQPTTLKGEEFAALLDQIAPELIIVAAYGKILPKNVLDYPKYGCINIHGSLLPEYRGAAPMQRAIIDGKEFTLSQQPVNIIWGKLDSDTLDPGIREAYVLKCNTAGRLTLPFDATGMQCALCKDYMLDPAEEYPFSCGENGVTVDLDASAAERFLVFYR